MYDDHDDPDRYDQELEEARAQFRAAEDDRRREFLRMLRAEGCDNEAEAEARWAEAEARAAEEAMAAFLERRKA